jgi:hypothetical protein
MTNLETSEGSSQYFFLESFVADFEAKVENAAAIAQLEPFGNTLDKIHNDYVRALRYLIHCSSPTVDDYAIKYPISYKNDKGELVKGEKFLGNYVGIQQTINHTNIFIGLSTGAIVIEFSQPTPEGSVKDIYHLQKVDYTHSVNLSHLHDGEFIPMDINDSATGEFLLVLKQLSEKTHQTFAIPSL